MRTLPLLMFVCAATVMMLSQTASSQPKPAAASVAGIQPKGDLKLTMQNRGGYDTRKFIFTGDGTKLIGLEWTMEIWDVEKGQALGQFGQFSRGHDATIAAHPSRPIVITTLMSHGLENSPVISWDIAKQQKILELDEGVNTSMFTASAIAPDGHTIWLWESQNGRRANGEAEIHVWEVETGDEIRKLTPPAGISSRLNEWTGPNLLTFAPSGWWVAAIHGRRIVAIEVATGRERAEIGTLPAFLGLQANPSFRAVESVEALAVSGDGRQVLVGCSDGAIRRWAVDTGRELPPLVGHANRVRAIWCSPDGKVVKSMGDDKILLWDISGAPTGWQPPKSPSREQLIAAADALGTTDPGNRYAAYETLLADPLQAVAILRSRVKPVAAVDRNRIAALVQDLDGTDYNARKRAARELRQIGEPALPGLEPGQNDPRRFRPDALAPKIARDIREQAVTPELVQTLLVVEVLERIGNAESQKVLADLAAGAAGASLTRLSGAAVERIKKRATPTALPALTNTWDDLRSKEAALAYRAIQALTDRPTEAVPLLREKLTGSSVRTALDPMRIPGLIASLGSEDFKEREEASMELAKYGKAASATFRTELAKNEDPEVRRRLDALLKAPIDPTAQQDAIQAGRAIEALERIGTPDARSALEMLGKGATNKWFQEHVSNAAKRLGK